MDNTLTYQAAINPLLAVRLAGGPRLPHPGYPEVLRWKESPTLDIPTLQEDIYFAIQGLPPRLREVIEARFGEACTLQEYGDRIGRTKERVRQLEGKALRKMRYALREEALRNATEVVPIPGSALDPDWVGTKEAAHLTGYTRDHIRWLCRQKKVICQVNPLKRSYLQISKASLQAYVDTGRGAGRKKGQWKEHHEQALSRL